MVTTVEEVSGLSLAQAKSKVVDKFLRLGSRADKASHSTQELYVHHFNRRVSHRPVFRPGYLVYVDKRPTFNASRADMGALNPQKEVGTEKRTLLWSH